jgi:hypothetical protein
MKKNILATVLGIVAGLLTISNFIYRSVRFHKTDYEKLFLGIFFILFGIAIYFRKKK